MKYTPSAAFTDAAAYLSSSSSSSARASNTTKLELYGLYKHLTVAPVPQTPRPSLLDMTGRAKWDAWNNVGKRYHHGADVEKRYLEVAQELGWAPGTDYAGEGGEVWDEDLGVNVSLSSTTGGGMGGSVSAMAAPDGRDERAGEDALHSFAIRGNLDGIAQLLAENPLAIDQLDEYGYTALHLACDRGNLAAVKLLIANGADATIKDPDDLTGLELARIAGHDEICTLLQTEVH